MCATCGCENNETLMIQDPNDHELENFHQSVFRNPQSAIAANREHPHADTRKLVEVEKDILHQNNLLAERNRGYFDAKNIFSMNLVSSPGSGKTTLLEKTLTALKNDISSYVIEGDQQSTRDADRIHATGTPVIQINTGKGCHLDAHMVLHAIQHMKPKENSVMFIENVGNLVCPAMFDLGESSRVVIASVTEGDDKPLKYPDMFQSAQLCIINKTDLLPYLPFDLEAFRLNAMKVNPALEFIEVSALKGDGLKEWYNWLTSKLKLPEEPETGSVDHLHIPEVLQSANPPIRQSAIAEGAGINSA
jgi:hydrogenase nickel incorporation protein HypB